MPDFGAYLLVATTRREGPDGPGFRNWRDPLKSTEARLRACSAFCSPFSASHRQKIIKMHAIGRSSPLKTDCTHYVDHNRKSGGRDRHQVHGQAELVPAGSRGGDGEGRVATQKHVEEKGLLSFCAECACHDYRDATFYGR